MMTRMMLRSRRRERGATAIEYGLIAALIAAVLVTIITITGVNLSTVYCSVAGKVGVAGGVANECNNLGGGIDNPPATDCDANGNYTGDILWIKAERDGYQEWDYYPATASQAVQDVLVQYGYTVLVKDATAREDDGLEEYNGVTYDGMPLCNYIGPNPDCDAHGFYIGDYTGAEFFWVKYEEFEHGYYQDSVWSGGHNEAEDRAYTEAERGNPTQTGWAVYPGPVAGWGTQMDVAPADGLPRWWQGDNMCSNGGGGDNGGDNDPNGPNCDDVDGSYTGSHDNWYWTQRDVYEHGETTVDAYGSSWSGSQKPVWWLTPQWEGRGFYVQTVHAVDNDWTTHWIYVQHFTGTDGWGDSYDNFTGYYYSPYMFVEFTSGYAVADGSLTEEELLAGDGLWISKTIEQPAESYGEDDKGALSYTEWWGEPDAGGGVQKGTPPEASDGVYVDFYDPCRVVG